jgi:spore photoproduct lyase
MIETIYVQESVSRHPRTMTIRGKYPRAQVVGIGRYGEVFNHNHQSFRLQKRKPSLILAEKMGTLLMEAPYGVGGRHNFYFSHVLNCLYDCRYCFLQGMYRSAHYVVFVNYEDFEAAIREKASAVAEGEIHFFSGYDGDSLALEPLTGFVEEFLPFFAGNPRLVLELRTKSVAIRPLLDREPLPNVIVAFSFTPAAVSTALEHGVPPIEERIRAAALLAERGFRIGLRFDPLVYFPDYPGPYRDLFREAFRRIPADAIHSAGFGAFRLPRDYFERMRRLYPEEPLFASTLEEREGVTSYPPDLEREMKAFCLEELKDYLPAERLFSY